ncbi:RNA 2',3'-cyclic phosphodiesterase [Sphingomonas sp. HF-S4]|uniref:RNA 2',3'-cyclic phosphodiesterase n=1 Tax=Sphingomonas agrestis TaxID=3080540 RepID=A0ABU3YC18_9SPHN|nr:RNA 2',3'-cyclic phosphodiesterase [Sphingomonas sp. HF-S4]MDV3458938.1 RNA 2',3'-cyclic phosphodiesterase [Sphingomonas sp. HF-S4]
MHRLFVGLRPPPAIRAQLLALMGGVANARWQDDAQLHITLRFIGEVARPQAEDAAIALSNIHYPPIPVALAGVGQFDSRGRPNALWAGLRPRDALAALHKKIDQALVRCGLEPERRAYLPHITLARMNASAGTTDRFLEAHAGLASPNFTLDHFLLFESTLGSEGAAYEVVERYPLRA